MRRHWAHQPFVNLRRCPLPNWLILFLLSIAAVVAVIGLSKRGSLDPVVPTSSEHDVYKNYRRLREQVVHDFLEIRSLSLGSAQQEELSFCGKEVENFVPCYNVSANRLAGFEDGEEFSRHCEVAGVGSRCLVRPPKDYKIPLRWPAGRDVIWSGNVKITKDQFLSSGSLTKRLMLLEENQIAFHSDDDGVKDYSRQIAEMIGLESDSDFLQAGVRTVLDIECGFGSFGAHLSSLNLMTVCIAAYEIFGSQVQLSLERGLPAMIGNFMSRQLPYPSLSFDMIHCAHCGIVWDKKDGALLIEVDRVLKPGGYFILTSPASKHRGASLSAKNRILFTPIEEFAQKLCWSLLAQLDETLVLQKTSNADCYASRKQGDIPPVCKDENDAESYYKPLLSCISGTTSNRWVPVQNRSHRPFDSQLSSDELALRGIHPEDFLEDFHAWTSVMKNYWSLLTPLIFSDHPKRLGDEDPLPPFNMIRNVMDMNAHYGGLNAAFLEARKSVWVMNVVPIGGLNTLPLILDRGFAGVDPSPHILGHMTCFMQRVSSHTSGWVIFSDKVQVIEQARTLATQNRWDARVIENQNNNDRCLLVCRKPFLKK
ncbi:putative methyltransferase PMT5 [Cinnamomum micranthum f. kanehirae]|uniref:Methyltransferase n=1 Tax=Cinnamomum micranthum f. kanehirae TaxID=337451 RepID=A0A443NFD8_9MAGN|nr:putative methyltransferase PMT5 [Cinnamomum micranthum f. kanehirae]